jgi:hypothetical protein
VTEHGYPHHLAGETAPPPEQPAERVVAMALKAGTREREAAGELRAAGPWRSAVCLDVLFGEADAHAPRRNRATDGRIGNPAHAAQGDASDHNPWLIHDGRGIVRAGDLTNDPALELPAAFERLRAAAAAGRLPQVLGGGYAILNGRITAEDWAGWRTYRGPNPHVSHGHVSVSLNPAQFDSRAPWGIFAPAPAPPPAPRPAPKPPAPPVSPAGPGWTGPDLTGTGLGLRGDHGDNGPRVAALQRFWRTRYPAYAKGLAVDGWWGDATSRVCREFAHRSMVRTADGRNIGPQLARKLTQAGFRG